MHLDACLVPGTGYQVLNTYVQTVYTTHPVRTVHTAQYTVHIARSVDPVHSVSYSLQYRTFLQLSNQQIRKHRITTYIYTAVYIYIYILYMYSPHIDIFATYTYI